MYIVTDDPESFPPLPHMIFSTGLNKWKIISPLQARDELGSFGGRYVSSFVYQLKLNPSAQNNRSDLDGGRLLSAQLYLASALANI